MKYEITEFDRTEREVAPVALTIAGSDSGGGAGIQADIKTFTSLGVFGTSALTAITAQNTVGVPGIHVLEPSFVTAQIDAVATDFSLSAAKTGMLANADIIHAVAQAIRQHSIPKLVIDPVMVSKTRVSLLEPQAKEALVKQLFPLATVVTPNIPEAEEITGFRIVAPADMRRAAMQIKDLGPQWVVVKGGHMEGEAIDLAYNGEEFIEISSRRYQTKNTHGTGCTFSAAITAYLALGATVVDALLKAKEFITWAIANSLSLGHGHGPVNHFYYRRPTNSV